MLKNYFKIAYRNLLKNKIFSLINILGLAIGMVACLLILTYVHFELSYDDFHEKADRIYRVQHNFYNEGELQYKKAQTFIPLGPALQRDFPEVEAYARLWPYTAHGPFVVSYMQSSGEEVKYDEEHVFQADASFLTIFSFPMLAGDSSALIHPNTIALSASTAYKYFGRDWKNEVLGSTLQVDWAGSKRNFTVTGVFQDVPENSHLKFDILFAWENITKDDENQWRWDGFFTYILLKSGTCPEELEGKLPAFAKKYLGERYANSSRESSFHLQPLRDIHLHSNLVGEAATNGSAQIITVLSLVAAIILLLGWANFVNLSTAKATERAREVGMRKVMGSQRHQIIAQFVLEATAINIISLLLAFTLFQITLPYFASLVGHPLPFSLANDPFFWCLFLLGLSVSIFLSSSYPAFVLSSLSPIKTLKGKFLSTRQTFSVRQILIIFQFTVSIALVISLFTIHCQVSFMRNQDLGMNIKQTVVLKTHEFPPGPGEDSLFLSRVNTLKSVLLQNSEISALSATSAIPGQENVSQGHVAQSGEEVRNSTLYYMVRVDADYLETLGLQLLTGRNFQSGYERDNNTAIINVTAAHQLGFDKPEDAIGQHIRTFWDREASREIIGVIHNYHSQSLKVTYEPLILIKGIAAISHILVDLNTQDLSSSLKEIENTWHRIFPEKPFEYFFLDDYFNAQYQADIRLSRVFDLFSTLSILIACMGLFGLSSYTAVQRTKEIGIRKALGASVHSIITLLSRSFIKLVMIASLIALPVSYLAMQQWLKNYAFRIEISWWMLALPIFVVLLIAILTVIFQTIKAALSNPSESLRYE